MVLYLSSAQIVRGLCLNEDDTQQMTKPRRSCIVDKRPDFVMEGEVYVVAGHKVQPGQLKKAEKVGETL
jgi:hypothetical protein